MQTHNLFVNNSRLPIYLPDKCPYCDVAVLPMVITYNDQYVSGYTIGLVLKCPRCEEIFFAKYPFGHPTPITYPSPKAHSLIPPEMGTLYPEFYTLYQQTAEAETHHLDAITGMGYRKALEFLVKHYLLDAYPEESEKIKKETLSQSISRIQYPKIQSLAKAASWIGNDETHLEKKNPEYGVPEMKSFIQALCYLILAEHSADSATELLNK